MLTKEDAAAIRATAAQIRTIADKAGDVEFATKLTVYADTLETHAAKIEATTEKVRR